MASAVGKVTVPVKPVPWKEGDREVPAVLGHDEGQPAYGVAVKTWRNGPKLYADIVNVPPSVANAVKAGQYFQTSAEVYDDTGEAGLPAGGGCMLRRIALLGADIPQVKTLDDLPKPDGSGNLKGVEIFAAGTHRGITYTERDLDKMVANFERYSAPAVKFSADSQRHKVAMVRKFASGEQTGPRGGKFHISENGTKVYEGDGSGNSGGESKPLSKSQQAYQKAKTKRLEPLQPANRPRPQLSSSTSSTGGDKSHLISDSDVVIDPPEVWNKGGKSQEKSPVHDDDVVIDPPEVWNKDSQPKKSLLGRALDAVKKPFTKQSEVPMDRQRIIEALVAAGMDVAAASNLDDATLQALQPVADKMAPGSTPPEMMADDAETDPVVPDPVQDSGAVSPPPVTTNEAADSPEFDRTALVAQLVGKGLDANELNALSDDDLKLRLQQINAAEGVVQKNADMTGQGESPDDPMTTPGAQPDIGAPPQKLSDCDLDGKPKKMSAKKYAEQQKTALHLQLQKAQEQINATVAQAARDVKRANFEAFKESLRAQGRLVPAMEEKGLLDDFVDALDHTSVRKFGEGKKTQFDMFREILGMVPRVVKFGETMKSSNAGVVKLAESVDDDGEAGVRTRYRKFSEKYSRMGFKEDEAVEAFKKRKAKNPLLTASDILPD